MLASVSFCYFMVISIAHWHRLPTFPLKMCKFPLNGSYFLSISIFSQKYMNVFQNAVTNFKIVVFMYYPCHNSCRQIEFIFNTVDFTIYGRPERLSLNKKATSSYDLFISLRLVLFTKFDDTSSHFGHFVTIQLCVMLRMDPDHLWKNPSNKKRWQFIQ